MPLTARAPLNRLTIPCFATCYLPLRYSGDWPRRKKQRRNRRKSKTADAARWRDMALCESPEPFLRRSGIAPITTGARLDVIMSLPGQCAWLGHLSSRPRFQKLRCITPMLGMSDVEVAWRSHGTPAVRTGLGIGGVIPNVVAVNNRAAPQFGLRDLLLNINSAATAR
jgi:hypothetical protein